jgi:hypothetical protein
VRAVVQAWQFIRTREFSLAVSLTKTLAKKNSKVPFIMSCKLNCAISVVSTKRQWRLTLRVSFTYQIDNGKWFPLNLRKSKASKKAKKAQQQADHNTDSDEESATNTTTKHGQTFDDEELAPRARYNAMTCVQKGILYIYGGILEVDDKEYTLDDFWSINVDKMTEYVCMKSSELDEQEWLGEQSDDDDEDEEDGEDDDDASDEENEEDENENESVSSKNKSRKKKKTEATVEEPEEEEVPEPIEEESEQVKAMNKLNQLLEQDVSI